MPSGTLDPEEEVEEEVEEVEEEDEENMQLFNHCLSLLFK